MNFIQLDRRTRMRLKQSPLTRWAMGWKESMKWLIEKAPEWD